MKLNFRCNLRWICRRAPNPQHLLFASDSRLPKELPIRQLLPNSWERAVCLMWSAHHHPAVSVVNAQCFHVTPFKGGRSVSYHADQ